MSFMSRPPNERPSRFTDAIVCRRGHVYSSDAARAHPAERCPECGAKLLESCDNCGTKIRGELEVPGVVSFTEFEPNDFCHNCGTPFSWAGRQARIYQLQNLLDEEDLDEATRLAVAEELEALATTPQDQEEEARRWKRIQQMAPGLMQSGQKIIETVVTAAIKAQLGL